MLNERNVVSRYPALQPPANRQASGAYQSSGEPCEEPEGLFKVWHNKRKGPHGPLGPLLQDWWGEGEVAGRNDSFGEVGTPTSVF